jgi:hypothetical protein
LILLDDPLHSFNSCFLELFRQKLLDIIFLRKWTEHFHFFEVFLLFEDDLLEYFFVLGDQESVNLAVELIFEGGGYAGERLSVSHFFGEILFTEMHDDLFESIFENLVFPTDIKIVKEMFFPLCYVVLLVYKIVYILKILIDV